MTHKAGQYTPNPLNLLQGADRPAVDCEGVPTLPDWLLAKIANKQEPTPEDEEAAKPALKAAVAVLRKRVEEQAARKTRTELGAGTYRARSYARSARRAEPRQMQSDYTSLAAEISAEEI